MTIWTPRAGQVWRKNGSDRKVRIETTDHRWAEVRNVETGRFSRMELYTFNRKGKAGWTRIDGTRCPENHGEQCCGQPRVCVIAMYGEEAVS